MAYARAVLGWQAKPRGRSIRLKLESVSGWKEVKIFFFMTNDKPMFFTFARNVTNQEKSCLHRHLLHVGYIGNTRTYTVII